MDIKKFYSGKKIVITAGPTREYIDSVRFISNESSGSMGYSLSAQAAALGARVVLISGPVSLNPPAGVRVINVVSAEDMCRAVKRNIAGAALFISSAAVSDFTPQKTSRVKIKKKNFKLCLKLKPAVDILNAISRLPDKPALAGFSLEDTMDESEPLRKMREKKLDFIFVNTASNLSSTSGSYLLIHKSNKKLFLKRQPKSRIALKMLKFIGWHSALCLMAVVLCLRGAYSAGQYLNNGVMEVSVSDEGYFSIGTAEGDPRKTSDNSKKLLFGHPYPGHSKTKYKIDGTVYEFGSSGSKVEAPVKGVNSIQCSWQNLGVLVKQKVSIEALSRGIADSVKIYYKFENKSSESRRVALKLELDTLNGIYDNAHFYAPGRYSIDTDTLWEAELPAQIYILDSLDQPTITAAYTFSGTGYDRPERVAVGYWPDVKAGWDYSVVAGRSFLDNNNDGIITGSGADSDSGLAVWWGYAGSGQRLLEPGGSFEAVIYLGLANLSNYKVGGLDVALIMPEKINFSDTPSGFGYLLNPFPIGIIASNSLSTDILNAYASIKLPEEFNLGEELQAEQKIESNALSNIIAASSGLHLEWLVYNYGRYTGERKIAVNISDGSAVSQLLRSIEVAGSADVLHGIVVDENKNPVSGAMVSAYSNGVMLGCSESNSNGEFSVSGFTGGGYSLVFEAAGYQTLRINGDEQTNSGGIYALLRPVSDEYAGIETFAYPNPVNEGCARISIRSSGKQNAEIKIFNSAGEPLVSEDIRLEPLGYAEYLWNISDVNNGVYFYMVESGGKKSKGKIAVLKYRK